MDCAAGDSGASLGPAGRLPILAAPRDGVRKPRRDRGHLRGGDGADHERVRRNHTCHAGVFDAGYTCWPEPSPFTRYAIYAFVALIEVFVVFALSLRVESKIRDRDYAPEWRR